MRKAQRRVSRDGPPPIQNFSNAIGGNAQPPRQLSRAHSKLTQLFRQMFSRMNCHNTHESLLMIINHLNVRGAGSAFPSFEAYPPLVVNPYAVLPRRSPFKTSKRLPGNTARSRTATAASRRSSFKRAGRSMPENAFTRLPSAKYRVRLSR